MALADPQHLSQAERAPHSPIDVYLEDLHGRLQSDQRGAVADYIPELFKASPHGFGITLATVDGKLYSAGDASAPFTIQSMSKPFTYGLALEKLGRDAVLERVGVEPTGEAFNSIVLDDEHNRPFNPMVNAGAIAVANLLIDQRDPSPPEQLFSQFAGRTLDVDEAVLASENLTGHRNRAIAYMMLNTGMIDHSPETVLDFYFRQCSVLVTSQDMALMAATLANLGRHPQSGEALLRPENVQDVLTLMSTCGMYDYAGQWAYDVGIPAKSGVAGGVIAVIPGQAGIAIWSPPLDEVGNSVRGVEVCKAISRDFGLHVFAEKANAGTVIRRQYRANEVGSKRLRSASEREWLSTAADRIQIIELQGALYFGPAEQVIRQLAHSVDDAIQIVVDFSRASYVDRAAARLLTQAFASFCARGCQLVITGLLPGGPLSRLYKQIKAARLDDLELASDIDTALEAAEDDLLASHHEQRDTTKYAFASIDIFAGMASDDYKVLEKVISSYHFSKGDFIVQEGDPANALFVIASGSASVSLAIGDGRRKRLASVGPGFAFGEMALVEAGKRTADVIADGPVVCYVLSIEKIDALRDANPQIPLTILSNLVRTLSKRLQQANQEIRMLE